MGKIAGLHRSKTRSRWAEGFHDELHGHVFDLERDGPLIHHVMKTSEVIYGAPTTPTVKG